MANYDDFDLDIRKIKETWKLNRKEQLQYA